jgi:hypothetical protein
VSDHRIRDLDAGDEAFGCAKDVRERGASAEPISNALSVEPTRSLSTARSFMRGFPRLST